MLYISQWLKLGAHKLLLTDSGMKLPPTQGYYRGGGLKGPLKAAIHKYF